MPDHIPLPAKQYSVIYADPPWAYSQGGNTKSSHGIAKQHYPTMTTAEICALPVREIVREGAACFMWATFPNITEAIKVMEAWGFTYKTAAFVWVKKNRKQGGNFMGLGAYTRANAEVCLLGVTPGFKAKTQIRAHNVHQIIEAPFEGHSKKPDETRQRIVELLGDVPRLEMFARQRADGWDARRFPRWPGYSQPERLPSSAGNHDPRPDAQGRAGACPHLRAGGGNRGDPGAAA